ncbi:hypothetical protein, partial [Burkholderia sp. PU8-34]
GKYMAVCSCANDSWHPHATSICVRKKTQADHKCRMALDTRKRGGFGASIDTLVIPDGHPARRTAMIGGT